MKSCYLDVVKTLGDRIRARYPGAKLWIYGSCAREEAGPESDIDICVVLPDFNAEDRTTISDMAWEIGLANDVPIATVVIGEENFTSGPMSVSGLVENIRSEGVQA